MKKILVLVCIALLVTMMSGCGKSKFECAIAHIDSLKQQVDTCKSVDGIFALEQEARRMAADSLYDPNNEIYSKAESDTLLSKFRSLRTYIAVKQMAIRNRYVEEKRARGEEIE